MEKIDQIVPDVVLTPELQAMADDVMTVDEACAVLKVGRVAVCRALQRGTMPGVKVGGQWRISKKQLAEYLQGKKAAV